jgi:hypothetical protein
MSTIDQVIKNRSRHRTRCEIIPDNVELDAIKELRKQHAQALLDDRKLNRNPLAPEIQKEIDERESGIERIGFVFEDIGRLKFEQLQEEYPPTDEQRELGYGWNPDTLSPALLHASCVEAGESDGLTLDQAQEIWDNWSTAEAELLVMTAVNAQMGVGSIPLSGSVTEEIVASVSSLTTAPIEESPTPTS